MPHKYQWLPLSLAVAMTLASCNRNAPAPVAIPTPNPTPKTNTNDIDLSTLPPVIRFTASDLDPTGNPCTDLHTYVNGNWLKANPVPSDRTSWGAFQMLDERSNAIQRQLIEHAAADPQSSGIKKILSDLWNTGMDEAKIETQGIDPLKTDLAAIDAITNQDTLVNYLRSTAAKGQGELFTLSAYPDFKDPTRNIAYISQSGLGLPDPEYYTKPANKDKLLAYKAHIAKVLELSGMAAADAAKHADKIIAFETRLAKVSKTTQQIARDVTLHYNPVTPTQANKLTPHWSWTEAFKAQGVPLPDMFSLAIPAFHKELDRMLADTDVTIWRAYLRFHTVDKASPYLSRPFVDEHFAFWNNTMRGQKEIKPRWKRVLNTINEQTGEALGQLYVKAAFPTESKVKMEALVAQLRTALKARIEKLDWMSPATKSKALAKWESFTAKIGYPDQWRSWDNLHTSRDSYLGNVLTAQQFNYTWNLSKIGKPVDKTEWGMPPQMVNAYYDPQKNEIVFPAAILQPPFFDPDAPLESNYGGIVAVIGHEMTHGYDDQGSRFGPTGKFEQWWTKADAKAFSARTTKLVTQFNSYRTEDGKQVNGSLTLGENIADLGGLNTAYDAMKNATAGQADPKTDGITREQRFFYNWATVWRAQYTPEEQAMRLKTDPHAPPHFRTIGPPSNMPSFAEAFNCKPGDAMVRHNDQQVVIW
ncbi:peptidase [Xylella fastidiosa subsp. fastidiosa]|jgi:putative endopeptidase|uniref:Metallopeptidase n=2 Tax=Xylella fastidiosa TaxID=2371 RepID=Q87B88_XYLFT|nr:M13 family metallopeptidase [Xylella fastidiosa]ADN62415.1 endothelin-converting protein 1 [Xylella fastidiosa subsp. fastidiosa GB514]KAF0571920.1 peptidase [Xylella fastidiosa subsp. fastidiosa Mus-1]AAO29412.1 metallopeptidase [Xylella fastidiosa Temecula1]ACB93064.1 Endothelin-converting enzyme 1 [Xylella fastidiosa M23]EGO82208.1 metalloendopeptidase PepO [Xylella fastidiosa EB92.1]